MYRKATFCAGVLLLIGTTLVASAPAAADPAPSHTTAANSASTTYDEPFLEKYPEKSLVVRISAPTPSPKPKVTPKPTRAATPAPAHAVAQPKPNPTPRPAPTTHNTYAPPASSSPAAYARSILSSAEFNCFSNIVERESGWNVYATNPSSGAYGLMQALPGSKMASAGADWRTNGATQVRWGISYMNATYGSPCAAWSFWQAHSWY